MSELTQHIWGTCINLLCKLINSIYALNAAVSSAPLSIHSGKRGAYITNTVSTYNTGGRKCTTGCAALEGELKMKCEQLGPEMGF